MTIIDAQEVESPKRQPQDSQGRVGLGLVGGRWRRFRLATSYQELFSEPAGREAGWRAESSESGWYHLGLMGNNFRNWAITCCKAIAVARHQQLLGTVVG